MKKIILFFVLICAIISCVEHGIQEDPHGEIVELNDSISIQYAEGFEVEYGEGFIKIITRSIPGNQFFKDSIYLVTNSNFILLPTLKRVSPSDGRIVCQSSTYLAYLCAIEQLDKVTGICGIDYVVNDATKELLKSNGTSEICPSDQIDLEALFASNAALFFTYPFGSSTEADKYSSKGIQTLLIAEYLEKTQLARLEWIKLFGLLTGQSKKANDYFDAVELAYTTLRDETPPLNKSFIMNLPFQDEWYMPSSKSVGVELIEDAGLTYFYQAEDGTENKLHAKEEVWNDGIEADYWIIIAREEPGFTLSDLCAQSPIYQAFKSVKDKHVIFCNTAEVDYFASGVVEPHVILKDLLFATNQIVGHEPQYFFLLE